MVVYHCITSHCFAKSRVSSRRLVLVLSKIWVTQLGCMCVVWCKRSSQSLFKACLTLRLHVRNVLEHLFINDCLSLPHITPTAKSRYVSTKLFFDEKSVTHLRFLGMMWFKWSQQRLWDAYLTFLIHVWKLSHTSAAMVVSPCFISHRMLMQCDPQQGWFLPRNWLLGWCIWE